MKNINWWKVASVAMMAASAILSFGHDRGAAQRRGNAGHGAGGSSAPACRKEPVNAKNTVSLMEEISKLTNKGD